MKSILTAVTLIALTQGAIAPAFADNVSREALIANERARVAQASAEIAGKKAELTEARGQISEIQLHLAKAKRSKKINTIIFIPAAVVGLFGLGMLKVSTIEGSGAGPAFAKFAAFIMGVPATLVGVPTAGITGYKIIMRGRDIDKFNAELSKLNRKIDQKLEAIKEDELRLAGAKRTLCLLDEGRPADCDAVLEAPLK